MQTVNILIFLNLKKMFISLSVYLSIYLSIYHLHMINIHSVRVFGNVREQQFIPFLTHSYPQVEGEPMTIRQKQNSQVMQNFNGLFLKSDFSFAFFIKLSSI